MGLFSRGNLAFEKINLSRSKIASDGYATITLNVKNRDQKFDGLVAVTETDDLQGQYLKIDTPSLSLPALDFPNRNTGDHKITLTPHNIPLSEMSFRIHLKIMAGGADRPVLEKKFSLTVTKKQ
ncbi:hypothetical protein [Candidatus Nitrosotenuis cloacae]|jgi:hypothetical protein|uniref:hypothetical protein n=1 Tax=Candidatus Nitrosotenuis cloacae TaxID=1603555 RepID=UPI00228305BC|nr:hypothetical protein [Candidatus Nitrosotenuis cloacae]